MESSSSARLAAGRAQARGRETAAAVLTLLGLSAFLLFALHAGSRGLGLAVALVAFSVVFLPITVLSVRRWREAAAGWVSRDPIPRTAALLSLPLAVYLLQGTLTGTVQAAFVWQYVLYAGAPAALVLHTVRRVADPLRAPLSMAAVVLVLWIPLDFGLLTPFRVPADTAEGLNLMRVVVLGLGVLLFTVCAPVRDLGFTFRITAREAATALMALAALALVLVPLGLAIGFLEYGVIPFRPLDWAVTAIALYFATTLHEEFIFRGLIQNLVEKRWRGPRPALAGLFIGAAVFGLMHLNNAPTPNYRYVLMASIAGLAYGWVWLRTRKVTVSALTHLGVNWIWMTILRGG